MFLSRINGKYQSSKESEIDFSKKDVRLYYYYYYYRYYYHCYYYYSSYCYY